MGVFIEKPGTQKYIKFRTFVKDTVAVFVVALFGVVVVDDDDDDDDDDDETVPSYGQRVLCRLALRSFALV